MWLWLSGRRAAKMKQEVMTGLTITNSCALVILEELTNG